MDTNANGQVMTMPEVAAYLKVAEKTVQRLIQRQEIPCAKVGNQWRFVRGAIDAWLLERMRLTAADTADPAADRTPAPGLARLLRADLVLPHLRPGRKAEVLAQLVAPLSQAGLIPDAEFFLAKLLEREEMVSTAVGFGLAVPHLRHPGESPAQEPCLVIGRLSEGLDFQAVDGQPTYLFCLVCAPSEVVHLRLLARLANMARDRHFLREVLAARDAAQILGVFAAKDREINVGMQSL